MKGILTRKGEHVDKVSELPKEVTVAEEVIAKKKM